MQSLGGLIYLIGQELLVAQPSLLVDEKRCVIIKKGDPLFRVSFYPPNLDDSIILKKETNTEVVQLNGLMLTVKNQKKIGDLDCFPKLMKLKVSAHLVFYLNEV